MPAPDTITINLSVEVTMNRDEWAQRFGTDPAHVEAWVESALLDQMEPQKLSLLKVSAGWRSRI